MNRRQALAGALLGTLGSTAWLALQPDEPRSAPVAALVPLAAKRAPAISASASATAATVLPQSSPRTATAWGQPPPAVVAAWSAPPPPSAPAAASAPERAPPPRFPYTWIGQVDDGSQVQALLNGPLRSFGVHAGEVLDGRWRVEAIAATRLQLTFLPTGEAVNLDAR